MNAQIIAYRRGFETNPALIETTGIKGSERNARLRAMQQNRFEVPVHPLQKAFATLAGELPTGEPERFVRVDAVDETRLISCTRSGAHKSFGAIALYSEPMPSAALSLELGVDLHYVGKRHWNKAFYGDGQFAGKRHVLCRSHDERLRVADYLAHSKGGLLELDGELYDVSELTLVDRTVVYASRRNLRRSNVGSPMDLDRAFTARLSPVMEELAPVEVKIESFGIDMFDTETGDSLSVEGTDVKIRKVY